MKALMCTRVNQPDCGVLHVWQSKILILVLGRDMSKPLVCTYGLENLQQVLAVQRREALGTHRPIS